MLRKFLDFIAGSNPSQPVIRRKYVGPKYLAFDIEIAKEIPDGEDWAAHKPFGISCAAVLPSDTRQVTTWHGHSSTGTPTAQMSQSEVQAMVWELVRLVNYEGYILLTWNGLGFDFPVLAEESGLLAECQALARDHVDMMFNVLCLRGHRLALDTAAKGMGLPGKTEGMTGADAPKLWASGEYEKVLGYVSDDVEMTLDVGERCWQEKGLEWMSQRGNVQRIGLSNGWYTVEDAYDIPEPDTSWMTDPPTREDATAWLE